MKLFLKNIPKPLLFLTLLGVSHCSETANPESLLNLHVQSLLFLTMAAFSYVPDWSQNQYIAENDLEPLIFTLPSPAC